MNDVYCQAEAERALAAMERLNEAQAEIAAATSPLAAYWAGSATASVLRDYRAGRVRVVKAR